MNNRAPFGRLESLRSSSNPTVHTASPCYDRSLTSARSRDAASSPTSWGGPNPAALEGHPYGLPPGAPG
eukprot:1318269-Alexandrium_andersonii.AAC.1